MNKKRYFSLVDFNISLFSGLRLSKIWCKRIIKAYLLLQCLFIIIIIMYHKIVYIGNIKEINFSYRTVIIYLASILLHEFGHVLYAKAKSCIVIEQGFSVKYFVVGGYSLIKNIKVLNYRERVLLYLFGSFFNVFILMVSLLCLSFVEGTIILAFIEVNIINLVMILFNLSVLPYTDGYYILMILFDIKKQYIMNKSQDKDEAAVMNRKNALKAFYSMIYKITVSINILILVFVFFIMIH